MRIRRILAAVAILAVATPAQAVDGVLEINQACAVQTGCFAGDTPGFPVTITQDGSYRLTGNLDASSPSMIGIDVTAPLTVTIDFNGFVLKGYADGSEVGVRSPLANLALRNGTIASFAGHGVELGNGGGRIRNMAIGVNQGDGVNATLGTVLVRECSILENAGWGLRLGSTSGYGDNVINGNGLGAVEGGEALTGNACDDATCSPPRARTRRYYLTVGNFSGADADESSTCAPGYHFASLYEILHTSALQYDVDLGFTVADSGLGPPQPVGAGGWVRTGHSSAEGAGGVGLDNCDLWTSSSAARSGSMATLEGASWQDPATFTAPWDTSTVPCSYSGKVWCVEDE